MASGVLEAAIVGWLKRIWLRLGGGSTDEDVGTIVSIDDGAGGTVTNFGGPPAITINATLAVGSTTSAAVETLGRTILNFTSVMNTGSASLQVEESNDQTTWKNVILYSPQTMGPTANSFTASTSAGISGAVVTGKYVRFAGSGITGSEVVTIVGHLMSGHINSHTQNIQTWGGTTATSIAAGDGDSASTSGAIVASRTQTHNGATWDAARNNVSSTLLASAARTVTTSSADQTNFNGRGVKVVLNVSAVGTGDITLTIQGKDPISGNYYTLLVGANVTTNSTNIYTVYPGVAVTANVSASDVVPRTWRISVTANNANSVTYSVSSTTVL